MTQYYRYHIENYKQGGSDAHGLLRSITLDTISSAFRRKGFRFLQGSTKILYDKTSEVIECNGRVAPTVWHVVGRKTGEELARLVIDPKPQGSNRYDYEAS